MAGVSTLGAGGHVGDIGKAIEKIVRGSGFSIVQDLGGHGVGHEIHEEPFIPNFNNGRKGELMEEGGVFAIEPMINAGGYGVTFDKNDGYTVRTADGSRSAHFELTVAIGSSGPDILTPLSW